MKTRVRRTALIKCLVAAAVAVFGVLGFGGFVQFQQRSAASSSGPSASHTNAPGEDNCTACHISFPVNGGDGSITISGLPTNYLPGQQVPLTVKVTQANAVIYGFQMTAIDKDGGRIGTYTIPSASPSPPPVQVISGLVNGLERSYIEHTTDGIIPAQFGFHSWTFTFNAPARRMGKIRFYAAGNAADSDASPSGDRIYTTAAATLSGSAIANYDTDARSDLSVYRPSDGTWFAITSGTQNFQAVQFGQPGDIIAPGDYDGDGKTDRAVWRPSNGTWYFLNSSGSSYSYPFGLTGDIPVAADYDGDLKTDIAVWRPSNGKWYMIKSSDLSYFEVQFGLNGDKPVPADYDGDARAELAVFRPSTAGWFMIRSADQSFYAGNFGLPGDQAVQGDYDGDGRADLAVYRPTTSTWYVLTAAQTFSQTAFGLNGDLPAPADFDGDGKTDIAVYRSGTWYILGTDGSTFSQNSFGLAGDIPVPRGYIPQ